MEDLHVLNNWLEERKQKAGLFHHYTQTSPLRVYLEVPAAQHIHYRTGKEAKQWKSSSGHQYQVTCSNEDTAHLWGFAVLFHFSEMKESKLQIKRSLLYINKQIYREPPLKLNNLCLIMTIDNCYFLIKINFVRFLGYKHGIVWCSDDFHNEMEVLNYFNVLYQLVYARAIKIVTIWILMHLTQWRMSSS